MTSTRFSITALCGAGLLATTSAANAADIRKQLTPELIYEHCVAAGVGSETEGTFMLPGGRLTGTIACTQQDLVAVPKAARNHHDDDDDDDDDDHHGGREHGEGGSD